MVDRKVNFKFSPDILIRLGEELISNPEHGIIELVKNSYDADAIECTVDLKGTNELGGMVVISDDGAGMDLEAISSGWFLIGHSKKSSQVLTPLGRSPAGNKGLGRFAALRLGTCVTLATRPSNEPGLEYSLTINWKQFEEVDAVEAINFDVMKQETTKNHGTQIIIDNLQVKLGREEIQKLARELIILADPFADETGFHPRLIAPEFTDLEQQVRSAYFDDAEFHLKAQLNEEGLAEAWLLDWQGKVLYHTEHPKLSSKPYKTVSATFELWVFILSSQSFSTRKASLNQVQDWLSKVGGVRLYYHGLRVRPYGDSGYDWLDMNLARARDPEDRPSTNTSLGMIYVNDPKGILLQKTDRMGFIESETFFELKRFATDALNWMARERKQASERKRRKEREKAPRKSAAAKTTIEQVVGAVLPEEFRPKLQKVLQQYEQAKEH